MEKKSPGEEFDCSLDDLIKQPEKISRTIEDENAIKNPNSFSEKVFAREPLKSMETAEETAKKLEEARKKIAQNHQGKS